MSGTDGTDEGTIRPLATAETDDWHATIEVFLGGGSRFSQSTRQNYRLALRRLAETARSSGCASPTDLELSHLEVFGRALEDRGFAPRTRELHVSAVKRFLKWCRAHDRGPFMEEWRIAAVLPSKRPGGGPPVSGPLRSQMADLLDTPDLSARDRAVVGLAGLAGLRSSEIAKLEGSDLYRDEQGIYVVVRGKRNRERAVPLVDDVAMAILEHLTETGRPPSFSGPLFEAGDRGAETRGTKGLSRQTISRIVREVGKINGVQTNPRGLRHSFGVEFLEADGNLAGLQELLGHQSLGTTSVYLKSQRVAQSRETIERQLLQIKQASRRQLGICGRPELDGGA